MNDIIAIYGSRRQESHLNELSHLFVTLTEMGFRIAVHPKLAGLLREKGIDMKDANVTGHVPEETALALSIGGDGTFLRTARWVGDSEIPILGVNTGHLGFLSSCRLDEIDEMLHLVVKGEITVERRMMLEVICDGLLSETFPFALNEVAFMKEDSASMLNIKTEINGNYLADYRADGLIVSTPTGSTAYNLSAGGPVVEPTLSCMVISPIAPHTLTVRPVVVGGDSELQICVDCRSDEFRLSIDGRSHPLEAGEKVRIRKAKFSTLLVHRKDANFANVLRDKLLWNASSF